MARSFNGALKDAMDKHQYREEQAQQDIQEVKTPSVTDQIEEIMLGESNENDSGAEVDLKVGEAEIYTDGDTKYINSPIGEIPYGKRAILNFKIGDPNGKYKTQLNDLVNRTGCYIIPASVADVPYQVGDIQGYDILEFGGVRYYCSILGKASEVDLRDYCDMIIKQLERTGRFQGTLMYRAQGRDFDFRTLRFGKSDLGDILKTFEGWKPQIVAQGEDLYLIID